MPMPQPCPESRPDHPAPGTRLGGAVLAGLLVLGLGACATGAPSTAPGADPGNRAALADPDVDAVLERADAALAEGLHEPAMSHYQMVLRHHTDNGRARLGMAEVHLASAAQDGSALEAAHGLFVELADDPDLGPRARQGLGLVHLKAGRPDRARAPLDAAVAADPTLWRAWNALGAVHDRAGDWDAAATAYDAALAAAPPSARPTLHNNLGFSLMLQGRLDEAVGHLMEAMRGDRDLDLARTNLRLALAWQGHYERAVAGARSTERAAVLNNVGYIALLRGDLEAAESLLSRAIDSSPSHFDPAWNNLDHLQAVRDGGI